MDQPEFWTQLKRETRKSSQLDRVESSKLTRRATIKAVQHEAAVIQLEIHSESTAELRRGSQARVGMLTASSGQGPATQ